MIDPTKILVSKYRWWGDIYVFFDFVKVSGYPYFEWNNRIFQVLYDEDTFIDTGYTL